MVSVHDADAMKPLCLQVVVALRLNHGVSNQPEWGSVEKISNITGAAAATPISSARPSPSALPTQTDTV